MNVKRGTSEEAPGSAGMMTKYRVNWDNGAGDCGTFPWTFDTYEAADAHGRSWALESNLRDFGTEDPADVTPYSYGVIEVVEASEDEDPDNDEGAAHYDLKDKWGRL